MKRIYLMGDSIRFGAVNSPGYGVYVDFLERIYKKLRILFPNAKIIFALSTPVV